MRGRKKSVWRKGQSRKEKIVYILRQEKKKKKKGGTTSKLGGMKGSLSCKAEGGRIRKTEKGKRCRGYPFIKTTGGWSEGGWGG